MSTIARVLAAMVLAAFVAGPIRAAAAPNATNLVAQATNATISGVVVDDGGSPVAGAKVELHGPATYSTTTDANGAFSIENVVAGFYLLSADKAGFDTASESDFTVFAGEPQKVSIAMHRATFTALRTIATVRSTGRGQFNTTPASVNVVTSQDFLNQGQPQVGRILNQIPGVQNTLPTASANGNVAGAITVPNIR
ncbi:MAG TPA: carboxypeptidase-like regulatory domain-containing protein, partial [Candidatus Baltobacteraceae bacterium]|nr:carboxypeptidase-like regulatory domain-containing protein [Candidatus Baltobacteraceae bacterium]